MRNLCLDIGNVLCHVEFEGFIKLLSSKINISYDEVWNFLNRVQKLHDLGVTNLKDELRDHFKIKSESTIEELMEAWNKSLVPNLEVINRMNKLVYDLNIRVALLSNIGFEHANLFNETVKFDIATKHFSCYVGARKPTLLYYQSFLQQYPQFNRSVYIDDNLDNLSTGKKMGFNSVYFNLEEKYKNNSFSSLESAAADILLADKLENVIKEAMEGIL